MKKLFMVCTAVLLVLAATSQAAPTITCVEIQEVRTPLTATDVLNAASGQADTYFLPAGVSNANIRYADGGIYYRWYNQDWGWTHTYANPAPATIDAVHSATLAIEAWDVDGPEADVIAGDGTVLGPLTGSNDAWATTSFTLTGGLLDDLLDGSLDVWMDIDSTSNNNNWAVAIRSSTLTVDYETLELVEVEVPCPNPIPAPGAIILGSLGAGIVGFLRRRRTL